MKYKSIKGKKKSETAKNINKIFRKAEKSETGKNIRKIFD